MSDDATSLQVADDRWTVSGPMTMDSVATLLKASTALAMPASGVVDLERVVRVDSAGVAVLLAWKRRAAAERTPLRFAAVPQSMLSLAELYGVEEMLTS
jgi:phospholipid transport system transporter-binding protein